MSAVTAEAASPSPSPGELIISADSHVLEHPELWSSCLPASYWPEIPAGALVHEGGSNSAARLDEMSQDGVSAEVLYPTLGLSLFALEDKDAQTQERAFRIYNDWLTQYCQVAPDRLVGIGLLSTYDIDHAIAEMQHCHDLGMPGVMIWEVPPPTLALRSAHYQPLWAAAQDLDMPVSLHILTGHTWGGQRLLAEQGLDFYRKLSNQKLSGILDSLFDLIFGGVFDRFPRLKVVLVENEIGWIPWMLQMWDRYFHRSARPAFQPIGFELAPSDYFRRNIWATFFEDAVGASMLGPWGVDNCMWSNDFPHANSTWPHSRETIAKDLAHLSSEDRTRVLCSNVVDLYQLAVPAPLVR